MAITKERLQALIDNPIDERIMNHERLDILKMALSSIELHTDSLQNYRESLEAYQGYIKSLRAENTRLREALEFYADKAWVNIKMPYLNEVNFDDVSKPFPDQKPMGGRRAREALKGAE